MNVEAEESDATLGTIVSKPWFLDVAGPYLSLAELHNLQRVDPSCRSGVAEWIVTWPVDTQETLRVLRATKLTKVFTFGGSRRNLRAGLLGNIGENPLPILQHSFASLTFDPLGNQMLGTPWSGRPPIAKRRVLPCVHAADDSGTNIFYWRYGSRFVCPRDAAHAASELAAHFNFDTASWQLFPSAAIIGRISAGVCRLGSRVYIIGGWVPNGDRFREFRSVRCFDLQQEQWIDSTIPDYPGRSSSGFTTVAFDERTIMVTGGVCFGNAPPGHSPMVAYQNEVFSLDILSATWTRLPPNPCADKYLLHSSFLYEDASNGSERSFAVNVYNHSFRLVEPGRERWVELPEVRGRGINSASGRSVIGAGDRTLAVSFWSLGNEIHTSRSYIWEYHQR